jgi:hypothetical protein
MFKKFIIIFLVLMLIPTAMAEDTKEVTIKYMDTGGTNSDNIVGLLIDGQLYELNDYNYGDEFTIDVEVDETQTNVKLDNDEYDEIQDIVDDSLRNYLVNNEQSSNIDENKLKSIVDNSVEKYNSAQQSYFSNTYIPKQNEFREMENKISSLEKENALLQKDVERIDDYKYDLQEKDDTIGIMMLVIVVLFISLIAVLLKQNGYDFKNMVGVGE